MADNLVFSVPDSLLLDVDSLQFRKPTTEPEPEPEPDTWEIDYFEYDTDTFWNKYYNKSNTGNRGTSSRAARSGTRGCFHNGPDTWDWYSTTESWSSPSDNTLPNYPATGTKFELHCMMPEIQSGTQAWLLFGGQSSGVGDEDRYQIELIIDSSYSSFRVRRDVNRSRTVVASDYNLSHDFTENMWYKILVDWWSGGGFDIYLFKDSDNSLISHISSTDDYYTGKGRIGMRIDKYSSLYCDDFQLVSDEYFNSLVP